MLGTLAIGIFNAGSNIGAILAPLLVPLIAVAWGWQWAFILTGLIGFVWLIFWLTTYRKPQEHPKLSIAELNYITQDGEEHSEKVPWLKVLPHRETLTVCLLKFVTDPVWYFFAYWLPKFLNERHDISLLEMGPPVVTIFLISDLGSIVEGWLSSHFIKRGRSVDFARKTTILIFAFCALPIIFASRVDDLWTAVALISLGMAAHQACSTNFFSVVSDVFPKNAVASVTGLAGMSGAVSGMFAALMVGWILQTTGSYILIFSIFSSMYLVAWVILKVGIPRIELKQL